MQKVAKLVVKSNTLIESKYKLTTREQKIMLYLISHIKKEDEEFKTYTFPIKKFADMMGMKSPNYNELVDVVEELQKKTLRIKVNNKDKKGTVTVGWLSYAFHNETEGTIDMRFDPFLKPYLLQLKTHFTSYELKYISQLKRSYSIRLYELLKQYEEIKERTFDLVELREFLGIEDKYTSYGNIKQKILEPSKNEIKTKTDIYFELKTVKKGRKVDKIKFLIYKQDKNPEQKQISMFDEELERREGSLHERVNELTKKCNYSVDVKTTERWKKFAKEKWKDDFTNNLLCLIDEVNYSGEIENPIGFITWWLKECTEEIFKVSQKNTKKIIRKEMIPKFMKTSSEVYKEISLEEKEKFEELTSRFKD